MNGDAKLKKLTTLPKELLLNWARHAWRLIVGVPLLGATTVPDTIPDHPNCKPIAVRELQTNCPGCGAGFQL
jgi:hypothetical protein